MFTRSYLKSLLLQQIDYEKDFIVSIQKKRNQLLDFIFVYIMTALGTHSMFLIGLPILFWLSDAHFARHLTFMLGEGVILSSFLKDWLCLPRPPSPPVERLLHQKSSTHQHEYGLPSTHSTNAATLSCFLIIYLSNWLQQLQFLPSFDHLFINQFVILSLIGFYAFFLPFSRVYCGMHSISDVICGSLLGASIVIFHYVIGVQYFQLDQLFLSTQTLVGMPLFLISSTFLFLVLFYPLTFVHPDPEHPCPCYDDAVCNAGVLIGVFIGTNRLANSLVFQQNSFGDPLTLQWQFSSYLTPLPFTKQSVTQLSVYGILLRIILGTFILLLWRQAAKKLGFSIGKKLFNHFHWPIYSGLASFEKSLTKVIKETEITQQPNNNFENQLQESLNQILKENDKILYLKDLRKQKKDQAVESFMLYRLSLEMCIKWIVYTGIGWIAVELIPLLFQILSI